MTHDLVHSPVTSRGAGPRPAPPVAAVTLVVGGVTLLTGFAIVPGPFVADVHDRAWVPGHLLLTAGFLLLALGLPAVAASLGPRRLGPAGYLGYGAVAVRLMLSAGSHLYLAWILPALATHRDLRAQLDDGPLARIYAGHDSVIDVVLGLGMLGLGFALARCGRGLRVVTGLVLFAALCEFAHAPFGLIALGVVGIWLGSRLVRSGDVLTPLRGA